MSLVLAHAGSDGGGFLLLFLPVGGMLVVGLLLVFLPVTASQFDRADPDAEGEDGEDLARRLLGEEEARQLHARGRRRRAMRRRALRRTLADRQGER